MLKFLEAFAKFQEELAPVFKGSVNPHYRSSYANLEDVIKHVSPLLTKNGLCFTQKLRIDNGKNIIQTIVFHTESGEKLDSEMLLIEINDAQKIGAAITYYKRYELQAILGLATTDDDAESLRDKSGDKQNEPFQGKSVSDTAKERDAIVNDVKSFLKEKTHGMSLTEGMAFLKKHFQANEMTDLNSRSNEELKRLLSNAMNYKEEKKVSTHRFQVDF